MSNSLPELEDAKNAIDEELYVPGELYPFQALLPSPDEDLKIRSEAMWRPSWNGNWKAPAVQRGIPGDKLPRYQTGKYFRRWGKEQSFKRLNVGQLPSPQSPRWGESFPEYPQLPTEFVSELPGFDEVKFQSGNRVQDSELVATRGNWGQLRSKIAASMFPIGITSSSIFKPTVVQGFSGVDGVTDSVSSFVKDNWIPVVLGMAIVAFILVKK